ncbi:hypothetical protein [Streptomyces sp. NPDC127066]|uniref:hypothetical protein n=1 Tax=Streptomyces sp. NPDC127066 TaxID=3347125 RepID=UPI0036675C72
MIPTSETALREAAFREANGLAPCKIQDGGRSAKTGFRDAAIWLSTIEYAREHPHGKSSSSARTLVTSGTVRRSIGPLWTRMSGRPATSST